MSSTLNVDNILDGSGSNTVKVGTATFQGNNLHLTGSTVARVQFSSSGTGNVSTSNNTAFIEGNDDTIVFNAAANGRTIFQENGTERARLDTSGNIFIAKTSDATNTVGIQLMAEGSGVFTVNAGVPLVVNRKSNDATIISIRQDGTEEGTITSSGSSISYNGFSGRHESSGIATDTPKGTVVSTIDELDVYPAKQNDFRDKEEDNPKAGQVRIDHAKVKISDTSGDSAVYGVVSDFTPQGKVNVISVGIGSILVTGSCARGDLLESNGDGTAKVQSDDIVRSKTIGKVTIGNSSSDVKSVSCVLYCG